MPKPIEYIVRPFLPGDVFTLSRLPPVTDNPTVLLPEDVHKIWDGSADTSYRDDGSQWYNTYQSDMKEDKAQRKSNLVKIVNPDDPDQHIFTERIEKATFKSTGANAKTMSLEFDWSDPKDSIG